MILFIISFVAGILTTLAPCTLPLLPVIIGGSVAEGMRGRVKAFTVIGSLGVSLVLFTLLLKVSSIFLMVPPHVWTYLSGGILCLLALSFLFPDWWGNLPLIEKLNRASNKGLAKGYQQKNVLGDILIGLSLGPVFSSCSPTYFIILATVLPVSFGLGLVYLLGYVLGLCLTLLLIALVGQRIMGTLGVASNPHGAFKKGLGVLFLAVGIAIIFGGDIWLEQQLSKRVFDVTTIEQNLLQQRATPATAAQQSDSSATGTPETTASKPDMLTQTLKARQYPKAPELAGIDAYLNTPDGKPITIAQYKGKNVVLIDFWTYSCINCQRTLPYVTAWYGKYKDQGLVIIGVHTPEFSFEKNKNNVADALKRFGIEYPVVLDNNYGTWNAFSNQYWPRKYLIDIDGYVVYDHAGEGAYDEAESAIQAALKERAQRLNASDTVSSDITHPAGVVDVNNQMLGSPEVYFGASRNEYLANATQGLAGVQHPTLPGEFKLNQLYLGGVWNFTPEYAESKEGSEIVFRYSAKSVYMVASSPDGAELEVTVDGQPAGSSAGEDVGCSESGSCTIPHVGHIKEERLYKIIESASYGEHVLRLKVKSGTLKAFTFTFG